MLLAIDVGNTNTVLGVFDGEEITPKTEAGFRDVDIDQRLTDMLRAFIGNRTSGLLFRSRKGTPLAWLSQSRYCSAPNRRTSAWEKFTTSSRFVSLGTDDNW